jgi:hypothetical protein
MIVFSWHYLRPVVAPIASAITPVRPGITSTIDLAVEVYLFPLGMSTEKGDFQKFSISDMSRI